MDFNRTMHRLTEVLATQAIRSGFTVRRTDKGQWLFSKGTVTVVAATPETTQEWWNLLGVLREAGMDWPPPTRWERGDRRDR